MESKEIHTGNETLACLIIDDPYLRPRYGALDYSVLLEKMNKHNFFTEIAFIPWNYRRNKKQTIKLFKDNPDRFGICVHGCHHTKNEFGITNYEKLTKLATTAMALMKKMQEKTLLPFDPVMVFPQGRFSTVAMKVLKEQGFTAAFNTSLVATDVKEIEKKEYLFPATKKYYDFPLFFRRYPKDKELFLDDIKNGRPIIIVEHAEVFKDGYNNITDLIDWINQNGNIKWVSLSKIVDSCESPQALGTHLHVQHKFAIKFKIKVLVRRLLSDFRDCYLHTNHFFGKIYRFLLRFKNKRKTML